MKLKSFLDGEAWERNLAILRKRYAGILRKPCESKAIFVVGKQRSGTTMLMHLFHRHPDCLVFDEHHKNAAFSGYRIREFATIQRILDDARYPAVCFKPICDSHRIRELYQSFPDAHFLWIYRDYEDVTNSTLRKFDEPTRAIRLICTGQTGGGWLQEGVTETLSEVLQSVYSPELSDFDLASLTWWVRNRIIIESDLIEKPNVTVVKYESFVSDPDTMLPWLFTRLGLRYLPWIGEKVSASSIRRNEAPTMNLDVKKLCDDTRDLLDAAFQQTRATT